MPRELRQLHTELLDTYDACLENATELLDDAEALLERESYPRAYVLAFTAIEEISKSQLAADLFTRFISQEKFDKTFYSHRKKVDRVKWATLWAHQVFGELPDDAVLPEPSQRMGALYVDIDDNYAPLRPKDQVSEHDAREMVRIGRAGLDKIYRWYAFGGPIGTKGFMK